MGRNPYSTLIYHSLIISRYFFFVCVFLSALRSYPFLELWKGNAVTTPEEYHSSDSVGLGKGSPELPTSPFGDSREVCGLTFRCHSL